MKATTKADHTFAVYSNLEKTRFVIRYTYKRSTDKAPVFGFSIYHSEKAVRSAARKFTLRGYVVAENGITRPTKAAT